MNNRRFFYIVALSLSATFGLAVAAFSQAASERGNRAERPEGGPATRPTSGPAAAEKNVEPKPAASRVVAVTVYQGTALVTREVDVEGGPGLVELAVPALPAQTVDSSLYTEAAEGMRVLSTRYRARAVQQDTRAEVREKEEQIRKFEVKGQEIQKQIEVEQQDQQLLGKLENFTGATMKELTEKGVLNSDSTVKLAQFIMETRASKAKSAVDAQSQLQVNSQELAFAQRQLTELAAGSSRTEQDAVIVVDKVNAGAGKVRLNYLVGAATWRPLYKLRATVKDAKEGKEPEPVQLEYLAEVAQQSGEDWGNVNMVLSTAEPMLNAAPPELLALDLTVGGARLASGGRSAPTTAPTLGRDNYEYSNNLRHQAQQELNSNRTDVGWQYNNDAAALQQTAELLTKDEDRIGPLGLGVAREGPSVTHHLKTRLTVPSRNDPQLIEVARIEMPPEYFYKAVPILSPHVYRLAKLTNQSDAVLLPGEATMYLGADFVGRMNLPLVAVGEQFTVGFGVDPQIQVTRDLVAKNHSIQGGNQIQMYDYRIRVQSFKASEVNLQVWDRVPRGESETVGVVLVKTAPELSAEPTYVRADRPKNLLRWDLTVKPGMTGEKAATVDYQFKLEYDRNVAIGNFRATK